MNCFCAFFSCFVLIYIMNQQMGNIGIWNAKGKTYSCQNIKAEIHPIYVLQSHRMCPACALPSDDWCTRLVIERGVVETKTKTKDEKTTRFAFLLHMIVCFCNVGLEFLDRDLSILCQNEAAGVTYREGHGTTFDIACLIRITALLILNRSSSKCS